LLLPFVSFSSDTCEREAAGVDFHVSFCRAGFRPPPLGRITAVDGDPPVLAERLYWLDRKHYAGVAIDPSGHGVENVDGRWCMALKRLPATLDFVGVVDKEMLLHVLIPSISPAAGIP